MKKGLSVLLAVVLMTALFAVFPTVGLAAADVNMDVSVSPTSLVTGGNISLNVVINNDGDEIQDVIVNVDGADVAELGNIAAGKTKEYNTDNYNLPTEKIGKDIKVIVKFTFEGEQQQISQSFKIAQQQANVSVGTAVEVDKTSVPKDTEVEFAFAIENQGDVKIENAQIKASALNGGRPVDDSFSLEPGKAKVIRYTGTIVKDITVEPVLTFTAAGKNYEEKMDTVKITVAEAGMDVQLTMSPESPMAGESVTFKVTMKNTGNQELSNIKLYDYSDNRVPTDSSSLGAGNSMTAEKTLSFDTNQQVGFYVTAEDPTGRELTFNSNVIDVTLGAEETPTPTPTTTADYASLLKLTVQVDETLHSETGNVKFLITLENTGTESFTNVVLSELTFGNIDSVSSIAGGEKKTFELEEAVEEPGTYEFVVTADDPNGEQIKIASEPVAVTLNQEPAGGDTLSTLLWVVGIIIVLIIGTGITLIVLVRKDKKKKAEEAKRAAARQAAAKRGGTQPGGTRQPVRQPGMTGAQRPQQPKAYEDDLDLEEELEEFHEPTVRRTTSPTVKRTNKRRDFDDRNNF